MNAPASLWSSGVPTIGLWHRAGTEQTAEIIGTAGFDWVCIDAQHGFIGQAEVRASLAGLAKVGCPSIVRTPWHDPGLAMRVLDAGAHGVLFPTIHDAAQAREAIRACKFPPIGFRSWCGLGLKGDDPEAANAAIGCGVMVETADAVKNLDQILAIDGLAFVFVGPDDLAISLGHKPTTEPTNQTVLDAIDCVLRTSSARGKLAGIYCGSTEMVQRWAAAGFTLLAVTSDLALLATSAAATAEAARSAAAMAQ